MDGLAEQARYRRDSRRSTACQRCTHGATPYSPRLAGGKRFPRQAGAMWNYGSRVRCQPALRSRAFAEMSDLLSPLRFRGVGVELGVAAEQASARSRTPGGAAPRRGAPALRAGRAPRRVRAGATRSTGGRIVGLQAVDQAMHLFLLDHLMNGLDGRRRRLGRAGRQRGRERRR